MPLNEAAAREVTLLQAFESADPPSPSWSDDDRAWANRVAVEAASAAAAPDDFLAQRARHALQRLGARERASERWLNRPLWRPSAAAGLVVIAFAVGLLADSIGPSQRINLLAPPLWGVLVWNALVYVGLIVAFAIALVRRVGRREPSATTGPLRRLLHTLAGAAAAVPSGGAASGSSGAAWRLFATLWAERSAALSSLRAGAVFHAAAAALALGLIAGLYARGLVLDYRAAWQSTFLSPPAAHVLVSSVLAPASRLSGVGLPDSAGFAALQAAHGDTASGAPAAGWIHLFALTLALFVVLPRGVLATSSALRAAWLAKNRMALPLHEAYFQRLLRLQRGGAAEVRVWPYAFTPSPQAVLGLRALLAETFGSKVGLQIAPAVAFGAEDDALLGPHRSSPLNAAPHPTATHPTATHEIAWFDLSATPEAEHQVRFAAHIASRAAAGAAVLVFVDVAAFKARFASAPERVAQRRDAWRAAFEPLGTAPVFADFAAARASDIDAALQAALVRPVRPVQPTGVSARGAEASA